ncbi:MFS transporter, partial [Burkholderia multivorans]|nr:MFS transporter [Burkholderia multivorans]
PQTLERLRAGAASLVAHGATFAAGDQATYALLDRAVRVQATTLALADNFRVAMAFAIAGALIGLLLRPARTP